MTTMIALLITLFLTPSTVSKRDETALVNETARLTVKYDRGAVSILKVERTALPSPERIPRWRGRFEARAVAGSKPLDFVRFDFPLMAAAEAPDDATEDAKQLGRTIREHVTATTIVRTPIPAGATSVAIYDTVTRKSATAELPAPGSAPPAAGAAGNTRRSPAP
jgi:hypothetical protein